MQVRWSSWESKMRGPTTSTTIERGCSLSRQRMVDWIELMTDSAFNDFKALQFQQRFKQSCIHCSAKTLKRRMVDIAAEIPPSRS